MKKHYLDSEGNPVLEGAIYKTKWQGKKRIFWTLAGINEDGEAMLVSRSGQQQRLSSVDSLIFVRKGRNKRSESYDWL